MTDRPAYRYKLIIEMEADPDKVYVLYSSYRFGSPEEANESAETESGWLIAQDGVEVKSWRVMKRICEAIEVEV